MANTGSLKVFLSCFCVLLYEIYFCTALFFGQRHMFVQGINGVACLYLARKVKLALFVERRICAVTWVMEVHLALEV